MRSPRRSSRTRSSPGEANAGRCWPGPLANVASCRGFLTLLHGLAPLLRGSPAALWCSSLCSAPWPCPASCSSRARGRSRRPCRLSSPENLPRRAGSAAPIATGLSACSRGLARTVDCQLATRATLLLRSSSSPQVTMHAIGSLDDFLCAPARPPAKTLARRARRTLSARGGPRRPL